MAIHYSQPKGFVGRQLFYRIESEGVCYGYIAFGSATRHLPGRGVWIDVREFPEALNHGCNNVFYHVEKQNGKYPFRNFTVAVLLAAERRAIDDWLCQYGDAVWWFESLVELPRTGMVYLGAGYEEIGLTKGFTCKRVAGKGSDSWSGKRVWNTTDLRPKRVFFKIVL
jgi:hypothetical protein